MPPPPRLKAEIFVKAHLRICAAQDIRATVVRHGEDHAGAVLIKVNLLDGRAFVLSQAMRGEGERVWLRMTGKDPVAEVQADEAVARAHKRDPDLWVIEIEDKDGRHGLIDKVE